ncbi:MAG: hypothetical protein LBI17_00675 [Rickettsiales bacterium]|jgi:hypothetical protein|nr:hypothetical protein [Rickettsiales bacterium]
MRRFGVRPAWSGAYAVFSPHADMPWLRVLRPGFRHCFVLLADGNRVVSIEPLASRIEIASIDAPLGVGPLLDSLEADGMRVVPARLTYTDAGWRFGVFTCVEVVKRVLGIRAPLALTPYRLYRHLESKRRSGGNGKPSV